MTDALVIQVPAGNDFAANALFYRPAVARGSLVTALPRLDAATALRNLAGPDLPALGILGAAPTYAAGYATVQGKFSGIDTGVVEPPNLSMLLACRCTEDFSADATKIPIFGGSFGDDPAMGSDFGFYFNVSNTTGGNASVRAALNTTGTQPTATIASASLATWRVYEVIVSGITVTLRDRTAGTPGTVVTGTGTRRLAANTILIGRDRNGTATRQGLLDVAGIRLSNVAWTADEAEAEYQRMKALVLKFSGIAV